MNNRLSFFFLLLSLIVPSVCAAQEAVIIEETIPIEVDADSDSGESTGEIAALFGDSLVSDPLIIESSDSGDVLSTINKAEKLKISGTINMFIGAIFGWRELPFWVDAEALAASYDQSMGFGGSSTLSFDAKPSKDFRVRGGVLTSFGTSMKWTVPEIQNLYLDYSLSEVLLFRVGKFDISWGHGIVSNPGNFVSDSTTGMTFRIAVPTVMNGLSFVVIGNNAFFAGTPSYRKMLYGASAEYLLGKAKFDTSMAYQSARGFDISLGLKTTLSNIDYTFQGIGKIDGNTVYGSGLFSMYWEKLGGDAVAYLEYLFSGESGSAKDHTVSLGILKKDIFGTPMDIGMKATHAFIDNSGTISLAASYPLSRLLKIAVGIPIYYGGDNTRIVLSNSDPSKRRVSVGMQIDFKGSF